MDEEVRVFDFQRIFLGDLPLEFVLEVAFRTAFMFAFTVILVRLLGKRGMGQLSPFELVIIIALGSSVGDPMFYPDVPLLHAMIVVTVIVLMQRALVRVADRSKLVERFVESEPRLFVREGVVDIDALARERFARDELFTMLREEGVEQLGQVKRAYLEPSGRVSVWMHLPENAQPGLPILPQNDPDRPEPSECSALSTFDGPAACCACGYVAEAKTGVANGECPACNASTGWVAAAEPEEAGDTTSNRRRRTRRNPIVR